MGGGKRKYNQAIRFRRFKKDKSVEIEVKKEPPKQEDVKSLIDLWQSKQKKKEHNEKSSDEENRS